MLLKPVSKGINDFKHGDLGEIYVECGTGETECSR